MKPNIFLNKKEAEINAALQRFQLLLYGNYYIQIYCKTINSESLLISKHLKYNPHLIPFSTAVIRLRLTFIDKAKLGVIMNLFFLTG